MLVVVALASSVWSWELYPGWMAGVRAARKYMESPPCADQQLVGGSTTLFRSILVKTPIYHNNKYQHCVTIYRRYVYK